MVGAPRVAILISFSTDPTLVTVHTVSAHTQPDVAWW